MMGFWDLSAGGSASDTGTEYEIPGGNMDPIPAGSSVLAMIDEAKWSRAKEMGDPQGGPFTGAEFVSLRWSVISPDEYKNRKIFHKLWVSDLDPNAKDESKAIAKRDKAKRMLGAIDANAGGKLGAQSGKPTDDSLTLHLCSKPMIITLMTWDLTDRNTGDKIAGNWVSAVAPKSKGIDVKDAPPPKKSQPSGYSGGGSSLDLDDSIPF